MKPTKEIIIAIILVILLTIIPQTKADIEININESGKIFSFYDRYYIYRLNGTITIDNPSNYSLYNIEIPIYLSSLDIRSDNNTAESRITPKSIYIYSLEPGEHLSFNYKIVGISDEDLNEKGDSVLANGIRKLEPKIYSNLFGTLKKAPLEDPAYSGRNGRLISVELRNPTDFDYKIAKIVVIKTLENNPNAEIKRWDFSNEKKVLEAKSGWSYDFIDENAREGEIYWLSTDIYIDKLIINSEANIIRYTQDDLFMPLTNATLNLTINETGPLLRDRIYLRKKASTTLMNPGETINMTIIVNNFEPQTINATVEDELPTGFNLIEVREGTYDEKENKIRWSFNISSGGAKRLRYSARYDDEEGLGIDYFKPAILYYGGKEYYSQSIPFVRKYVPEKKVFVQKNVKFLDGNDVRVTLTVKNLGETDLKKVMIKEPLLSTSDFRELTQKPVAKGLWEIEKLNKSEEWVVSYVTTKDNVLNVMPEVLGVPRSSVLQTIILSNLISSTFKIIPTSIIEYLSIIALTIIILLYFLPPNFFSRIRKKQKKELKEIQKEIYLLKKQTQTTTKQTNMPPPVKPIPQRPTKPINPLQSPERIQKHKAVEEAEKMLEKTKEKIQKEEEEKK